MGTPSKHHLMIIAGEASGDMRAAGLARALKALKPDIRLSGVGGAFMRQANVETFADINELAVIGVADVLKNLGRIKRVFDQTLKKIDADRPDAVILVDYPGFNLRLAREVKKRGIKVIYYISPQVWAWREKRVLTIKKLVDRMIVLFPFEQDIYSKYGMQVDYVGHPLLDEIHINRSQTEILKSLGLSISGTTIGLMPGSRVKEIERHLPCMLEAARQMHQKNPERQFILLKANSIPLELLHKYLSRLNTDITDQRHVPIKIFDGATYDGINAMDAAMVASGTATLETALLKKPMVVIYKTSWLTYFLAKSVIKIPYIGLVNIVAGKKVAEELVQNNATPGKIANALEAALYDPNLIDEWSAIKSILGKPGASRRAAQIILETLN